jgi:manganese/zinc/iron transport system ATP- binding protein
MSTTPINALDIHNITLAYNAQPVIVNITFSVPQGVMCALIGPNGAGKTSLLKAMVDLIKPVTGTIRVLGKPYTETRSRVAYVPQRSTVDWDFPTTVFDVVMMGCYQSIGWFKWPSKQNRLDVLHALEMVAMQDYAERPISQLSGGQQQRVFLARALVQKADLYLMDEPFVGIDMATEQMIVTLLKNLRSEGKTIIVVHHDLQTAPLYFDWGVLINRSLIAHGPLDHIFTKEHINITYGRTIKSRATPEGTGHDF